MKETRSLDRLRESLSSLRARVAEHEIYRRIETLQDLRIFMEHHVYAVWDFMSLLKALQRDLTCVEVPWVPHGNPLSRRLINEIVLEEESDAENGGGYISHFELYRAAMRQCGADTGRIDFFLAGIREHRGVGGSLSAAGAPKGAQDFVRTTMKTIESGSAHAIAGAFTLGREDVIPLMFRSLVDRLNRRFPGELTIFQDYLDRHIKLDEERHSPMALKMLVELCADDPRRWRETEAAAKTALSARIALWDSVLDEIAAPYAAGEAHEPSISIA